MKKAETITGRLSGKKHVGIITIIYNERRDEILFSHRKKKYNVQSEIPLAAIPHARRSGRHCCCHTEINYVRRFHTVFLQLKVGEK